VDDSTPAAGSDLGPDAPEPTRRRQARGCLFEAVQTLALTIVVFLGVQTFVAQPYQVQMGSMETTLLPKQYVLVDKLTPRWSPYVRGDIVVFSAPTTLSTSSRVPFIKRVIGLPGDHVQLRDGVVYVNGSALVEPYVFTDGGTPDRTDPTQGGASEWQVPDGELLVFGDHRGNSQDSRTFGPIKISQVIGRAWLRYWPLDTFRTLPTPGYPGVELSDLGRLIP
jgi:signal peptidase I